MQMHLPNENIDYAVIEVMYIHCDAVCQQGSRPSQATIRVYRGILNRFKRGYFERLNDTYFGTQLILRPLISHRETVATQRKRSPCHRLVVISDETVVERSEADC